MKTDLSKILAVSGEHGLFKFLAQARSGAIVEPLDGGDRKVFDFRSRITSLADISIYTESGELKLQEVFLKMKEVLGDKEAPDSKKAPVSEIKALFDKAIPDYDGSRFYVSHMKKVADWYNCILRGASFDFVKEGEEESAE
ncbi:MAG: DUF5606 domain-containing protein [Bacteroidales bacterium]|nr:DUF5606 domain-containing protein [Bacteroidales bacterium]